MNEWILYGYVFMIGACIGSFFNVCIYRMPNDESVISPSSRCPACKKSIPFYRNIPILSYLILKGKAHCCGVKISVRYFWVELITAYWAVFLFAFFYHSEKPLALGIVYSLVMLSFIVVTFIDFDHLIIPDEISVGGTVLGLIASVVFPSLHRVAGRVESVTASGLGILAGAGVLFLISFLGEKYYKKEVMGLGDVKLMGMIGAVGGWKISLLTIFLGSCFGACIGLLLIIFGRTEMKSKIPFGPYLALGAVFSLLLGDQIVGLYLKYVFQVSF